MKILLAVALDGLLGEPSNEFHPVAWFGRFLGALENRAPHDHARAEWLYGAAIAASGVAIAALPAFLIERKLGRPRGSPLRLLAAAILLKFTFAWRALIESGERVRRTLELDDTDHARAELRSLVSRDTSQLDASLLSAAAIESLAENASDSFIAPLFYYHLFGLGGACAYRAINTMDSMFGYRGRYEYLGKVPARLDDALNFIPARLTALLIVLASKMARADARQAWRIWRRDHALTASPNAGYPMSALAGALDVRLEKVGHYALNRSGSPPNAGDIRRAARVVSIALGIATLASILIEWRRARWRQRC